MFRITAIGAINFMSFEEVFIVPEGKCYVIQAENKDNSGQKSNGGGKTSLIDIVPVTLLGQSIAGRDLKKCVKKDCGDKSFTTFVELTNERHGLQVEVRRTIYSNTKSAELVILVNGEVPPTLPTKSGVENGVDIKAGNEYILKEILDISKEDLFNYFIICSGKYKPFLKASVDEKTEVISRFSNTTVIDSIIEKLELDLKSATTRQQNLENKIASCKGYIEAQLENISEEAEAIFEQKKQVELEGLQNRQQIISRNIEESISSVKELEVRHTELGEKMVDVDQDLYLEYTAEKQSLDSVYKEINSQLNELQKQAATIETYLAGQIRCPKCSHWFNPKNDGPKEKYIKVDLNHVNFSISQKQEDLKKWEQDKIGLADMEERVKVEMAKERSNKDLHDEQQDIKRDIASYQRQNDRYQKELNDIQQRIDEISARSFEAEAADILNRIEQKEKEQQEMEQALQQHASFMTTKQVWIDRFSEFKFYLANKPLEQIAALINRYLQMNGSDLSVNIEGFKKLKSGEIRPDLRAVIYRNWADPEDYTQFSEGEKCRLNISVDLTFQQLINSSSKYGGLDFYCNDELMNALDSQGISLAASAFNQIGKTIFLVSHSGADMHYENALKIVKENGTSTLQS
jgi:DNA repair exonuclease SbcCD ATPase subunit